MAAGVACTGGDEGRRAPVPKAEGGGEPAVRAAMVAATVAARSSSERGSDAPRGPPESVPALTKWSSHKGRSARSDGSAGAALRRGLTEGLLLRAFLGGTGACVVRRSSMPGGSG